MSRGDTYKLEEEWEKKYDLLVDYVEEHGEFPAAKYIAPNGVKLGTWVVSQRVLYKKMRLSIRRINMLEVIRNWSWDPLGDQWKREYNELCDYIEEHKRLPVNSDRREVDLKIGAWISRQRAIYKYKGLDRERIGHLESLPYWSWDIPDDGND